MKGENGYTEEQIKTKRKALEGVLVPVTSTWNEDMMYKSGFKSVQKFWQQLNFAGWVAFKS
jgi:tRNA (cmo5U34)-methyltransferase